VKSAFYKILTLLLINFYPWINSANAAGWHYYDPDCPISLNEKSMKFVAMQPKKNIDRVCDALSDIGPTVIVLDASDNDLRDMTWDIRILSQDDSQKDQDVVCRLPPQKYRNGMVNFDCEFKKPNNYALLATLTSDDGKKTYIGQHNFSVGLVTTNEFYVYTAFFICLLGALGIAFFRWRQKRRIF